jgi:enoyl-CoA hydratase
MSVNASPVVFSRDGSVATVCMQGRHGNALNLDLLRGLGEAFSRAAADPLVRGVLWTSGGKLFSPGLDLQELLPLERPAMNDFMAVFASTLLDLYSFPKPVVAALSGHAVAGGCVLALTADLRVLCRGAQIGLNEVKVGVPLPYGVTQLLRETVHRPALTEVALLGRNFSDDEAVATGLVHAVQEEDRLQQFCREQMDRFCTRGAVALSHTKNYLRQAAAERISTHDHAHRDEFLDCWFAPDTRRRIGEIVTSLTARNG